MFGQVLVTEFMKLRRCKVTWGTLGGLSLAPLGLALFMWIVREPGRAAGLGLLGTKADLSGIEATWPSFLSLLVIVIGIAGMLLLAFIVAYVYGREYNDATAKNMLALPVPRDHFALAKLVVVFVWWLVLVTCVIVETFIIGFALGLPGFSAGLALSFVRDALLAASISYLLVPPIAWVTIWGRGNMAPIAFALVMLGLGNLFGKTGWAVWFPWSVVPLLIGMVSDPLQTLPTGSYVVVGFTFAVGIMGTLVQQRWSDCAQ
jgi:ABC-2 type transport system permease protein